jgi:hypothetical protein
VNEQNMNEWDNIEKLNEKDDELSKKKK